VKTALLCRYGGIGDCLLNTSVANVLKKRGYEVDYVVGNPTFNISELFDNLDCFNNVFPARRIMGMFEEFIEDTNGNWISSNIIKSTYDLPLDLKHSIENNSMYPNIAGQRLEWRWFAYQNSNMQNWYDLSLGWAKIDPTTVPPEDKVPIYRIKEDELEWAKSVLPEGSPILGVQAQASSLVRTWYRADEFPQTLIENFDGCVVAFYRGTSWFVRKGNSITKIDFPEGKNRVRHSAALISLFDAFIAVDSGMAHIAEAVGTKSVVIYLTVPAWTRSQYYKLTYPIEPDESIWCHPCFDLNRYCWRIEKDVENDLSDREKKLLELKNQGMNIEQIAKQLDTNPEGIFKENSALHARVDALKCKQPYCSANIKNERILNKVKEALNE